MTEEASRKYNEKTPLQSRTTKGIWDVTQNATRKVVSSIRGKEFERLFAVANPANGCDFLDEVSHYVFFYVVFILASYMRVFHYFHLPFRRSINILEIALSLP